MWDTMAMLVSFPGHMQGRKQYGNEATHSSAIRVLPNKLLVTSLYLSYKANGRLVLTQVELCVVV